MGEWEVVWLMPLRVIEAISHPPSPNSAQQIRAGRLRKFIDKETQPIQVQAVLRSQLSIRIRHRLQDPRVVGLALVVFLFSMAFLLPHLWQPERQVRKHWERYMDALEDRRWASVRGLTADHYEDQWGMDKDQMIGNGGQALKGFMHLEIIPRNTEVAMESHELRGAVMTTLSLEGKTFSWGAETAKTEANKLDEPWVFVWEKTGMWPWSWQVARIENEGLELDAYLQRQLEEQRAAQPAAQ